MPLTAACTLGVSSSPAAGCAAHCCMHAVCEQHHRTKARGEKKGLRKYISLQKAVSLMHSTTATAMLSENAHSPPTKSTRQPAHAFVCAWACTQASGRVAQLCRCMYMCVCMCMCVHTGPSCHAVECVHASAVQCRTSAVPQRRIRAVRRRRLRVLEFKILKVARTEACRTRSSSLSRIT